MGMKLFDENGDCDKVDISKIEIDKDFARRYEHNKKREDLHRYQELLKKGQIDESEWDSKSDSDEEEDVDISYPSTKEDIKFFNTLISVRNKDPRLFQKDVRLFDSDSDSSTEEAKESSSKVFNQKKKQKPMYLKDVIAQHLIEQGPEFSGAEPSQNMKTYREEQEELKKAFLDAVQDAEENGQDDFLKVKDGKSENEVNDDGNDGEFEKKLGEYFGQEEQLDENRLFLKEFFMKKMWVDKGKAVLDDDEVDELMRDEEDIERQEKFEESYCFRHEEDAGDRVMGHSRKVEGSVRKKENSRKEQRRSKEERMKAAEIERKEELKRLKNLKKKEMKERIKKVMEAAGIKDGDDCLLDMDDLEEDFDPEEYDKKMKAAFGEKYYDAEDIDPSFGDNDEDDGDIEKPDFDKEDELLGLPKGWDVLEKGDGFLATRERILKQKAENGDDHDGREAGQEGDGEERSEESKRKRKRKMSLLKKVKEEMMAEYYKLDYEDTVGDLKTRFKYTKVDPNRFGLKTEEILLLDEKELNQYVSVKKLATYREKEWKVPNGKRHQYKKRIKELIQEMKERKTSKKKRSKEVSNKSTPNLESDQEGKTEIEDSNFDKGKLSRKTKRRHRLAELKPSSSRLAAYGKIGPKAKHKGKH